MAVPLVKICGVTRPDDGAMIAEAGADWIGLNFWPPSKRCVEVDTGRMVIAAARRVRFDMVIVGVFVNQPVDYVIDLAGRLELTSVQLHGDESPDDCARVAAAGTPVIKALAMGEQNDVARIADYAGHMILIDTPTAGYGGSGHTFDWSLARAATNRDGFIILAGGLRPENVAQAVAEVKPFGVDVASGVESAPGIKDAARVAEFVARAKGRADDRS